MSVREGGIWAVVPVKDFGLAKRRLAGALSPTVRRQLARAMLCDVLAALRASQGLAGVVVVTADPEAGLLAEQNGARLLFEHRVRGLNAALAGAARHLAVQRRAGVLVMPGDIPTVTPDEISGLVAAHPAAPAVSLVPAHDGQGTNALLLTPPLLIPFSFGPASFALHSASARDLGIEPAVHALPGFGFDIDTPDDLARLSARTEGANTRAVLAASAPR